MPDEYLTLEEVARLLRVSTKSVYRWAQSGRLEGFKAGQAWRFRRADVERWVDARIEAEKRGRMARS